jgi:tetratricopeptide (TPR) repeat protein
VKRFFLTIILILAFTAAGRSAGTEFAPVDALLSRGEPRAALERLQALETSAALKDEVLWRKARAHYELALISRKDEGRSAHLRHAEDFARQVIAAAPQSDEGYKWLAIALGARAEHADVKTQIELSRRIRESIEKALARDSGDDISLLVLSRWHYKVASLGFWTKTFVRLVYSGLPDASFERAEKLLWQAIAEKDRIAHRYSLAKVYHRMGEREPALEQLRQALTLPVTFPEEVEDLEKARRKLERWQ